ncbi:PREDICTED: tetraspanin-3-like [Acropora digitifera]|uniref:tetraspanin-3-like n=1 Tax=Acropora digitifera TaxID=70779 RepID=UPI00077AD0A6|nr:PREDICTED: tetraspanin-3-like [Acropora digitifera]
MGCAKVFLFFFNAIYLGISAAIIYLAVWLIKKFGESDISKITTDVYTFVPCGILVGIGVVIFITALFGCCGVGSESKCCLSVFVFLLFIVLALEVAAGVAGGIYQKKAEGYLNDGFIDAIKSYNPHDEDSSLKKAVDALQKDLKCCGSKHPSDWSDSKYYTFLTYPGSCCSHPINDNCKRTQGLYKEGCLNKLTDKVKNNLDYVLGTAIGVAVFQVRAKVCKLNLHW